MNLNRYRMQKESAFPNNDFAAECQRVRQRVKLAWEANWKRYKREAGYEEKGRNEETQGQEEG